ncbi:MAG: hypothetical protein NDI93_13365 [Pseudomonas sp.]|nr:hypothetical protein [Pseudomonas sp.]
MPDHTARHFPPEIPRSAAMLRHKARKSAEFAAQASLDHHWHNACFAASDS